MKRWQQIALWAIATVAVTYGMIYADVVMRARDAYNEGEKYWRWAERPEERQAYLKTQKAADQTALDAKLAQGKLQKEDYDREVELLQFDYEQQLKESSIKYAYIWYQTAVELFSPPDSKWVKLAREKMPLAKERWKAELREKKIPFEDYMID